VRTDTRAAFTRIIKLPSLYKRLHFSIDVSVRVAMLNGSFRSMSQSE
jgi:hypothetical protein